jgi:hypothetical protein
MLRKYLYRGLFKELSYLIFVFVIAFMPVSTTSTVAMFILVNGLRVLLGKKIFFLHTEKPSAHIKELLASSTLSIDVKCRLWLLMLWMNKFLSMNATGFTCL